MKRNWIPILILVAMIVAYNFFVLEPFQKKYTPPPAATTKQSVTQTQSTSNGEPATSSSSPSGAAPQKLQLTEAEKKSAQVLQLSAHREVSLFSDASVGDVVFKKYFQRGNDKKEPVRIAEDGFHWRSSDPRVEKCLRNLKKSAELEFSAQSDGVECAVKYTLEKQVIESNVELQSKTPISGDLFFETEDSVGEGESFDHRYLAVKKKDDKVQEIREKKLWTENVRSSGPFDWISWGDKYFSSIILPKGRYNPDVYYQAGYGSSRVQWGIAYPIKWSAENPKLSYNFGLYFALKDLTELRSVRNDLAETIDFGYFSSIARLMLWCLEVLFKIFGNYGVAIVVLSLVARLMLWPINRKMYESGQKMKDIQPQMEAIKKKYEGDKEKLLQMNQEIRALYAKAGVNPLGSCLPVVLQIPIFWGLNSALRSAVELYQAPFFGWIHDLSYKDPLYILPVVWTVSLMISVELNPQQAAAQPGMPDMKWMSRIMFVVFGFFSRNFSSGLNLYFFVSNLAGMSQQFLVKRKAQMATSPKILLGKER